MKSTLVFALTIGTTIIAVADSLTPSMATEKEEVTKGHYIMSSIAVGDSLAPNTNGHYLTSSPIDSPTTDNGHAASSAALSVTSMESRQTKLIAPNENPSVGPFESPPSDGTDEPTSSPYQQYLAMEVGTNWCADGFEPITSPVECEGYALYTDGLAYQGSGHLPYVPKGCYIGVTSNYVYFNTHPTGFTNDVRKPICKPIVSSWSVSPPYTPSSTPSQSSLLPTPLYQQYLVMDAGTNWCMDGFEPITSPAKCEEYALNTDGLTYVGAASYDGPAGCLIWVPASVYFNTHPIGFTNNVAKPVCKAISSAPSELVSESLALRSSSRLSSYILIALSLSFYYSVLTLR